jgi:hypothetical protein
MQKWEYTTIYWTSDPIQVYINEKLVAKGNGASVMPFMQQLGAEGWELTGIVSQSLSKSFGAHLTTQKIYAPIRYYFKRPIEK